MMSPDEVRNVGTVYRRLIDSEEGRGWGAIDDSLERLSWLDDLQLTREAEVAFCHHQGKNPRCLKKHDISECFIPMLIEAVNSVLELYRSSQSLHVKNRYILECYLAIDHEKMIVVD
jgi:hypothetical protein